MPGDSKSAGDGRAAQRQQRLAAELRANLAKRKAQARARAASTTASGKAKDPGKSSP